MSMPHFIAVTVANKPSAPAIAFNTISGRVDSKKSSRPEFSIGSVMRVGQLNSLPSRESFAMFLWAVRPTTTKPGLLFLK